MILLATRILWYDFGVYYSPIISKRKNSINYCMEFSRTVLTKTFTTVWRQRGRWWLALAVTWIGSVIEPELLRRSADLSERSLAFSYLRSVYQTGLLSWRGITAMITHLRQDPLGVGSLFFILGLIALVLAGLTAVSVVAQGAYVHGTAYAEAGHPASLGAGLKFGRRKFWPLLTVNVMFRAAVGAIFLLLWLIARLPVFLFVPAFVVGGVLALWLSALLKYAVAAMILENQAWPAAMTRAYAMLSRRWYDHAILIGSLSLLTLLFSVALTIGLLLALIPFLLLLGIARMLAFSAGGQLYFYLSWTMVIGVVTFAAMLLTSLHWTAWTTAFIREATGHKKM